MKSNTKILLYRTAAALALVMLALAALPVAPARAAACTFTSNVKPAGNWSNPATWTASPGGCGSFPGSGFVGDIVVIAAGDVITLDVTPINPIASLDFQFPGNQSASLNFTPGRTLNVSGNVTIPRAQSGHVATLNVGAGTLNIQGDLAFTNSGTDPRHQLTISTGIVNVIGSITSDSASNTSPTISLSGAGTLRVGGSFWSSVGGTLTIANGSTVAYNGAGNQIVKPVAYSNVVLSGSGEKTLPTGFSTTGTLNIGPVGSSAKANLLAGFLQVGLLKLGGVGRNSGTWGSSASGATFKNDVYFVLTAGQLNVWTDTRATPTVTSWPTASGITYGQPLSSSTLTGGSASVPGTFVFQSPSFKPNAGTYSASVIFNPTNSTGYKSVLGSASVTVAKANAAISITPYHVTYDKVAHTSSGTALGVNGEDLSIGLNLNGTSHTNAGTYSNDPWTFISPNTNYKNTSGTVTNIIDRRPLTVTGATGIDKAYDGTTAATVNFSTDALPGDIVAPVYTATFNNKNIGNNKPVSVTLHSVGGTNGSNYTLVNTTMNTTANITPLDITVSANAKTKFVGLPDPPLTYSVIPALPVGDSLSGALTRAPGEAEGQYAIQQGTLSANSNFVMTFVGSDLTIVPLVASNLDVYINNDLKKNYTVSPHGSDRDTYTGVNAGPVKLVSTNGVPIMAAERLIYKVNNVFTSFSEMMALPDDLLDGTYWLPWYNNVGLDTQLRIANVSDSTGTVNVYIGGQLMQGSPFTLTPGESIRPTFTGVNAGPVKVVSNVKIVVAERVIYKVNDVFTSFSEMMALPNSQLDKVYWLPWYNNTGLDTELRIANVSQAEATIDISIDGIPVPESPYTVPAGGSIRPKFVGINAGPVKISSNVEIVAAERVIYSVNGVRTSFSEMMAIPEKQLDNTYWLPWYNNVGLDTQLRFANLGDAQTTVHIFINGQEMGTGFPLQPGESTRQNFTGINAGPVQIVSDQPLVVAERVIYKVNNVFTSYSEMMGLPNDQLDTAYWLPWYNHVNLDTQLRFGVP